MKIFVQFEINLHLWIFQKAEIALAEATRKRMITNTNTNTNNNNNNNNNKNNNNNNKRLSWKLHKYLHQLKTIQFQ